MNNLIALGIMVLLVLSLLVAWRYSTRNPLDIGGTTSFTMTAVSEFALGTKFQVGTGNHKEFVRVVGGKLLLDNDSPQGDRIVGATVTVEKLGKIHSAGATVKMNRAQRRAKRSRP